MLFFWVKLDVFVLKGNYFGVSNRYSTYLEGIVDKVSDGTSINYKLGFLPTTPNVNDMDWARGEAKSTEVCIIGRGSSGAIEGGGGDARGEAIRGDRNDIKNPENQMQVTRASRE